MACAESSAGWEAAGGLIWIRGNLPHALSNMPACPMGLLGSSPAISWMSEHPSVMLTGLGKGVRIRWRRPWPIPTLSQAQSVPLLCPPPCQVSPHHWSTQSYPLCCLVPYLLVLAAWHRPLYWCCFLAECCTEEHFTALLLHLLPVQGLLCVRIGQSYNFKTWSMWTIEIVNSPSECCIDGI